MSEIPEHGLFKLPDGTRILVIDPRAKYVIQLPDGMRKKHADEIAKFFSEWWNSENQPVAFMLGGFPLIRLDRIHDNPGWPKREKLESIE